MDLTVNKSTFRMCDPRGMDVDNKVVPTGNVRQHCVSHGSFSHK